MFPANGAIINGREAFKDYWSESMAQGVSSELVLETVCAEGYDNMAIEEGLYMVLVGSQELDKGKYIVTWKKEEGQWRLHQDIWNSDLPIPQARAATENFSEKKKTVRLLRPVGPNKEGSLTYFYLMDPAISPDGYD